MSAIITAAEPKTDPDAPIRSSRRLIATAIAFSAAINLLYFAAPLYFVQVFTRVLASRSVETLAALSALVALCLLAVALLEGARAVVVRRAGEGVDTAFAPGTVARAIGPDRSGAPLADLDRLGRFYGSASLVALLDLPWVLAFVLALALLHPWLGALALAGVALLAALAVVSARTRTAQGRKTAGAETDHAGILRAWTGREGLAAALGLTGPLAGRWLATRETMLRAQSASGESQAILAAAGRALRLGFQCAAIGLGAVLVLQDAIGAGAMFAASLLLARALAPVEAGIAGLFDLRAVGAASARLARPISERPAAAMRPGAAGTGLAVERLSYRARPGDDLALAGIGLTLAPGEMLGLVGPSGSGKSLLLACLAGALPATTGSLRLGRTGRTPARVGYLPQEPVPLEGSLFEGIGCGRHGREAVRAAAEALDLDAWIESLPEEWATSPDAQSLPAGLRQRLAIARAICGAPPLVLLDEPCAHLDSDGERALLETIARLKAGGSVIVAASHRPSVLGLADRLLVLDRGRERMSGPRNDILGRLARGALQAVPAPAAVSA